MKNIICFGEVLWDVYLNKIEIGGAPFNVYHRLHSFGLDVNFISSVGKDKLGNNVINYFQKNNLSTNFLNVDKNHQTGQVLITLKSGEPDYEILENVAWDYIPFKNDYLKDCNNFDCIVYGSLGIRNDVSYMTLKKLISLSTFKIFDLNLRQNFYSKLKVNYLLNESDFLKINMEELLKLGSIFKFKYSDTNSLIESIYFKFNLKFICVTNGSINSSIYDGNNFIIIDSFRVKSIDNLGAGDNFLACFINEFFIKKNSIKNSLKIASAYGALTTTKI
ncbi:MAG: PfkB family carbohydrate kinase, partial [Proteobacteria bacterium]|nr:PfkB family carbohydrate kinase [Pseudomonadota bacterium]